MRHKAGTGSPLHLVRNVRVHTEAILQLMAEENRRHLTDIEFGRLKAGLIQIVAVRPAIHLGKCAMIVRAIAQNTEATITVRGLNGLKQTLIHAEKFFEAKKPMQTLSPQTPGSHAFA